ncbi:PKD domain-containing protein [Quadrisphaera sp. DSM 44207]|uniref:PKD domain-containing protein n=1 Tax=Quadrisphaera sp. DSM 44207 TaxID=1881057 RepID=UPI00087FC672|nr:PKD domain-containing protein [Quadrisphaera sp. DSM 44207]SDQ68173.1 PKD domain-containing protein [Quadrisphaera sp. DSM 44207]
MIRRPRQRLRTLLGAGLAATVASALALPVSPQPASAAPAVVPSQPTVSADALPTVQVDGVVWAQVVVGDRVYATGQFTSARPAGAAAGTGEVARSNVLAYDITTGKLVTSWAPKLNGTGLAITASPDGSRVYVGGSFTSVDGASASRVVALDAASGAVVTAFKASANNTVRSLAAAGGTVYAGGSFTAAGGQARSYLAAFRASDGAVTPWAPPADAAVMAMTAPAGTNELVVGGRFTTLNGQAQAGMGAVDLTSGATLPWAANATVKNYGPDSAIYSLSSADGAVYGTGYNFYGPGNLENAFAADAAGGALRWVNGCRGDTYSSYPVGGVLYAVGHAHDCSSIGVQPETSPQTFQRAQAFTTAWTGNTNTSGKFQGKRASEVLPWLPTLAAGTYTGQSQAAWSVAGNGTYVVLGGEFPKVNGRAQQGLVRFAVRSAAPRKEGPQAISDMALAADGLADGGLRISFAAAWDRDDRNLRYELLRGPSSSPAVVARTTADSAWWSRPRLGLVDPSPVVGTATAYRVRVTDPDGNTATSAPLTATAAAASAPSAYRDAVLADGAESYWRLDEASGTVALDRAGAGDLTLDPSASRGAKGATRDGDAATAFAGSAAVPATTTAPRPGPQTFSVEAWFQTTTTTGGKIVGFGDSATAASRSHDRQVYLTSSGQLVFGVYPGAFKTITSPGRYNDGAWHHVVATLGPAGTALFVDGAQVAADASVKGAQAFTGYWRVGGDTVNAKWSGAPATAALAGTIDDVAVYPTQLAAARVAEHHRLGATAGATPTPTPTPTPTFTPTPTPTPTPAPNAAPTASFTATTDGLTAAVDASASEDGDGTIAAVAWDFGDGATGSGTTARHTYAAAGTYSVTVTVTDDRGATGTTRQPVTVTAPPPPPAPAPGQVLAADAFARTTTSGWGPAETGGAWTTSGGTTAVTGGAGRATVSAGRTSASTLDAVSATASDVRAAVSVDAAPTGGGVYASVIARRVGTGGYHARARVTATGAVTLALSSVASGTETVLKSVSLTGPALAPGQRLLVRVQAVGTAPTTLRARAWVEGTPEPADWQLTATDSTAALQAAGGVGLSTYLSASATAPLTVAWDDLAATTTAP